jgi:Domain of unknown function (DUF4126)
MAPLATALGLGVAAGFNAWVTLLIVGLITKASPDFFTGPIASLLSSPAVLTAALVLAVAEFVADKIPRLDHIWEVGHTFLRPLVGALLALAATAAWAAAPRVGLAILAAGITLLSHVVKNATRVTSSAATAAFSQFVLSMAEDAVAVAIAALAIFVPPLALAVVGGILVLALVDSPRLRHGLGALFRLRLFPRGRPENSGPPAE